MTTPRTTDPPADDRPGPSVQLCLYQDIAHARVLHSKAPSLNISLFEALNFAQNLIRQSAVGLVYVSADTGVHRRTGWTTPRGYLQPSNTIGLACRPPGIDPRRVVHHEPT